MKFGNRIKEQRIKLKMTQSDVAKKLFTSRQTISNWEKGKNYPDLDMLIKISNFFQVSIDSLLREDKDLKNTLNRGKTNKYFLPITDFISIVLGFWFILQPHVVTKSLWSKVANLGLAISMLGLIISLSLFNAYISSSPVWEKTIGFIKKNLLPIITVLIVITVAFFVLFPDQFFNLQLPDKYNLYFGISLLIISTISIILELLSWILDIILERIKQ